MTRGTQANTNSVSRPVPGIASASMAMERKRTRMLRRRRAPALARADAARPRGPAGDDAPALGAPVEGDRLRHRRVTRAAIHAPVRPTTARVTSRGRLAARGAASFSDPRVRPTRDHPTFRHDPRLLRSVAVRGMCLTVSRTAGRRKAAGPSTCGSAGVPASVTFTGPTCIARGPRPGRSQAPRLFQCLARGDPSVARGTGLAALHRPLELMLVAGGRRSGAGESGSRHGRPCASASHRRSPRFEDVPLRGIGVVLAVAALGLLIKRGGDVRAEHRGRRDRRQRGGSAGPAPVDPDDDRDPYTVQVSFREHVLVPEPSCWWPMIARCGGSWCSPRSSAS